MVDYIIASTLKFLVLAINRLYWGFMMEHMKKSTNALIKLHLMEMR